MAVSWCFTLPRADCFKRISEAAIRVPARAFQTPAMRTEKTFRIATKSIDQGASARFNTSARRTPATRN